MAEFNSQVDIGNMALQACGAQLLGPLGFAETSKQARQVSFAYGKLRQAELRQNTWRFAKRYAALRAISTTTMLLQPALWASGTTYFRGSIVTGETGTLWRSTIPNNLGNQPEASYTWEPYFGPLTVSLYDTSQSYFSGEIVYTAPGDGTNRVYLSMVDGNSDNPATGTAWATGTTYFKNQVVTKSSVAYMSLIDLNTGNDPAVAPAAWSSVTTYAVGNKAYGTDGVIYQSVGSGNIGHDPTLDGTGTYWTNTGVLAPWTTSFVGGSGSLNWLQIGGSEFPSGVTLTVLDIVYPIGAGPSDQSNTRNIFRLPAGFLRMAPDEPKAGTVSSLGAPGNRMSRDWMFDGDYLVTQDIGPVILPFVADFVDVSRMDPLFCQGLAASIAANVEEMLTQNTSKRQQNVALYKDVISRARLQNAILEGSTEPPLDDWLACRY